MNGEPSLILILFSGLLSFFLPCMFPIVPIHLSYISRVGINEVNTWKIRFRVLWNTIFFVIGFSAVIIIIQAFTSYLINTISKFISNELTFKIAGSIIIILGLNMIGLITLNFLFKEYKIKSDIKPKNIITSLVLGLNFVIGWPYCIGAMLYSVIAYISKVGSIEKSIFYISFYCICIGVLFIITGFFMDYMLIFFKKLSKYGRIIEIVAGVIVIILGTSLFFNKSGVMAAIFN